MSNDLVFLFLRVAFGGMMLFKHGLPKLLNFSQQAAAFLDPLHIGPQFSLSLAIFAETFCALLVVLGLFTRWVSIVLILNMLIIIFLVHSSDPLFKHELAWLFLCGYMVIAVVGPGKLGLGNFFSRKRRRGLFKYA